MLGIMTWRVKQRSNLGLSDSDLLIRCIKHNNIVNSVYFETPFGRSGGADVEENLSGTTHSVLCERALFI